MRLQGMNVTGSLLPVDSRYFLNSNLFAHIFTFFTETVILHVHLLVLEDLQKFTFTMSVCFDWYFNLTTDMVFQIERKATLCPALKSYIAGALITFFGSYIYNCSLLWFRFVILKMTIQCSQLHLTTILSFSKMVWQRAGAGVSVLTLYEATLTPCGTLLLTPQPAHSFTTPLVSPKPLNLIDVTS